MPKQNKSILLFFFFFFLLFNNRLIAQEDSIVKENVVKLHYFNSNNGIQYLLIQSMLKTGRKTEPQKNIPFSVFLDSNEAGHLIDKLVTNSNGKAKAIIPTSLKAIWDASAKHKFIVVPGEGAASEFEITKTKISLDTSSTDGARSITVKVLQNEKGQWVPAKDVEMKIGIQRQGGSILSAGDAATYTTDSSGTATVEFKKDSLPGDQQGNFVLAAQVDDNDQFGNLLVEKKVAWGIPTIQDKTFFDQRTLWSTRFRTPFWLLSIAYAIVLSVWGTLLYLVFQFVKIRRLGKV